MNNIEMIEFYLKQEGEKTLSKIKKIVPRSTKRIRFPYYR